MNSSDASASAASSQDNTPPPAPPWKPGFWSLFTVQFQGAFSDNVFKFLVIFLLSKSVTEDQRDDYISLVLLLFSLPFILFAMTGGYLADRHPKSRVVLGTKWLEVGIMTLGTVGLFTASIPLLMVVIFLMSVQSTFFGPSKYGLMPEILPESKLSWGNGIIGLGTFLAIITGGIAAGLLSDGLGPTQIGYAGFGLVGLALAGVFAARSLPKLPAANPTKTYHVNFLSEVWTNLKALRSDRVLLVAILGSTYFWLLGALFGEPTIFVYSKDVLGLGDTDIGLLRAALALGIGLGSALAGILSGRKIEYGLVPLGALGLAISAGLMAVPGLVFWQVAVLLGLMGASGGFYIVPLNAIVQHRPEAGNKGSVIATGQWLNSVGVFSAAGVFWLLKTKLDLEPSTIFLIGSIATLLATVFAVRLVPDSLLRFVLWLLTHTIYRVTVKDREHLPDKGGALLVCNHVSLADACFLIASTDRHIRFIVHEEIHNKWWVKPFSTMLNSIPIKSEAKPREMIASLQSASEWIRAGQIVCIFAEGQITRTGQLLPFKRGMSRIMKGVDAPIVPVNLDNVWGSIFSFEKGRFYTKIPHSLPYPVTVSYGAPLPPTTAPAEIRKVVQELGASAWADRKHRMQPLHRAFIRSARRHPLRMAATDVNTPPVGFLSALIKTVFLARRLRDTWKGQEKVGILLPPSVAGALVNHAALLLGKVPVNLNYTLSEEAIASCIRQCNIQTVITSAKFLEKLPLQLPVTMVKLEDAAAKPRPLEKGIATALSLLCPARWLPQALGADKVPTMDDLATIIFSSGSTGDPKGVMLSHYNVMSNVTQISQAIAFQPDDRFLGILPFFHSFGFTGTLAASSVFGVGVAYHPNPMDARTIGELVYKNQITFLLATPTFLQIYLRGCQPEHFGSLRFIMVGAEKLTDRLSITFEETFGIRPMEAYGCTECSPAVSVNVPDFRGPGFRQAGSKRGTIGHPLPGVSVRIVDVETGEPKPVGEAGLMLIKGPNVMKGYLGQPEKTASVLKDGWYETGDVASVDEDGFITITDRLSRFSKIGGEMVPHIKIEEQLHQLAEVDVQTFAVTGVPDDKKGEKLMVLHTRNDSQLESVLEKLSASDLPNLWKPKRDQFIKVEAIPILGTGKTDLRQVREIAQQAART